MSWVATLEEIECGFFVPREGLPEDTAAHSFRLIGVNGLHDQVQFFHLRVIPDAEPPTEHYVLSFNGDRVTPAQWSRWLEVLRPAHLAASTCLMVGTHDHAVEASFAESSSALATAAAVAAVMRSGGWDERDSIPVRVDGRLMHVNIEVADRGLRIKIEAYSNAP